MQNEQKTFMEQKPFKLHSEYKPTGDQPAAIAELVKGFKEGNQFQTLLGVTGSGKTFTMANVIAALNKPTLVIAHNKTLAGQLYGGFSDEGELYRAFSAQEIPESVDLGRMHTWRAELPSARCTVSWRTERTGTAGGQGPSEGWTGRLSMTILEAEDLPQEPADSSHP